MYREPLIHEQTFGGGQNSDLADELMPHTMGRVYLNCQVVSSAGGNLGVVTNIMGNVLVTTPLPDGFCKTIGAKSDEKNNKFYWAVYNENGYHTWFQYDEVLNKVNVILQSKTDSDGIDIFRWSLDYPILHIDLIIGKGDTGDYTLLSWCDGLNKGCKFNIQKAMDKSSSGYGLVIEEDIVLQYKKTQPFAPVLKYTTDPARNSNYLYAQPGFKFCARLIYMDGEVSDYSDWSKVIYPPNQSYQGVGAIVVDNNCIEVSVGTGNKEAVKIEIAMQTGTLKWVTVAILNKNQLSISSDSTFIYKFYNDGSFVAADQSKIFRPNSYMFRVPRCQAFIKQAMTQTGGDEGFPAVKTNISVVNNPVPLFIAPGTENTFNSPSFTVVQLSYSVDKPFLSKARYNPVIQFTIGSDVKKGNVFALYGANGFSDNYFNSWTAGLSDTASTISSKVQAWLRGFGRGTVTGAGVDIGGNAFFTFNYFGKYGENITAFNGTAERVQYESLVNSGASVQVIKSGSTRLYAVGYEDDDGRKSQAYTNDEASIRTPFLTEAPAGVLQQPVHVVSIKHRPPIWAKYWMLYRTPDEVNFIQILIQKVINVVVLEDSDPGDYLDLVVGSLSTYQAIHPDVIIKYQYTKGDRLRLIQNTNDNTYYTSPTNAVFETTVLSYKDVTTDFVNAQIVVDGSDQVTPSDGPKVDYIGKNIVIAGVERTIIGVSSNKYVLDNIINAGGNIVTSTQPNYSLVDRRGIIRIAKPPADFTVADFSTVEIYSPQVNTDDLDFRNFWDVAMKFEISNYGQPNAAHRGLEQDQDGTSDSTAASHPAIVNVTEGEAYIRNRELPTNNAVKNTSVIVRSVEDPNFSDFFESNLNSLGRKYPTDDASGQKYFGSRTRFSNKYIVDTAINGLNDFDNLDRVDYNDAYGDVMATRYRELRLFIFKKEKDGWFPVGQTIINTADGKQQLVGTADKLLGDIQYFSSDAGIGNNPESLVSDENYMYHAAPNIGAFVRVAGDGVDLISKQFGYDFQARTILSQVQKYKLRIWAGVDKTNGSIFWSVPQYVAPVFANPIVEGDWVTTENPVPDTAVVQIVSQPAVGNVAVDPDTGSFVITGNTTPGSYTFTYRYELLDGSFTATKNGCITVVPAPSAPVAYKIRQSSAYCEQVYGNDLKIQNFTRNNCGEGSTGSIVPYTVEANKYTASTQEAADALAQAEIDANGQANANSAGTCTPTTVYESVEKSGTFQKDCSADPGTAGTYEEYVVDAGAYTSVISQADADAQAQADVDANGQAYANSHGTCIISSKKGTFLVDFYDDPDADLCFYCATPGVAESNIPVTARANNGGTGVARYPNDGRDPATCYLLSSDRLVLSGPVKMRFGVNMAYFIAQYPAINHFTFIMRGRTQSAGGCSGLYALRNVAEGYLAMPAATGEPSKNIPTVIGASPATTNYSSNIISGANGTTGIAVGNPVLQLDYTVTSDSFTITTY